MKTTIRFLAVWLGAWAMPSVWAASVSVVNPATVTPGNPFQASVWANQVTDLYAYQFDLTFDPSILQLVDIQEGPFLASGGATVFLPGLIDNTLGTATFTIGSLVGPIAGVSGTGDLADLFFTSAGTGTSPLDLSNVEALDSSLSDIPVSQRDGSVDVETAVTPEPGIPWWMVASFGALCAIALRRRARA